MNRDLFLACAALLALSGCGEANESGRRSAEARYRMTVEVLTPEGVKSGFAVWSRGISKSIGPISPYNASFKAEAVAVDLPNGQSLFMLVKGQEGMLDAYFPELMPERQEGQHEDRIGHVAPIAASGASKTLPCTPEAFAAWKGMTETRVTNYCPMLVTFKDIRNPASVAKVDPDNLAASFGVGYKLKAITVQVTDEPVTTGIDRRFVWWTKYIDHHFDGSSTIAADLTTDDMRARLSSGSFTTEQTK